MALRGTTYYNSCFRVIILMLLFLYGVNVPFSFGSSEPELLLKFRHSLQYENDTAFSTWNTSISPPCSGDSPNWVGVLCTKEGKISGLILENMGLKGLIDVNALQQLPNFRTLSFNNNNFNITWPELNKLYPLKTFYLSNNKFYGEIPARSFRSMNWLKKVHLANNQFSGEIPTSLAMLPRLMELRLEGNKFSGRIPNFQQKNLKSFSVANNQLQGKIPASLGALPVPSFAGNEGLCGTPLSACHSFESPSIITIVLIAIAVGVAVMIIGLLIFLFRWRKRRRTAVSLEIPQSNQIRRTRFREADEVSNHSRTSQVSNHSRRLENIKLCFVRTDTEKFDFHELLRASAEILGSGSFSSSYKAALLNGTMMVVKRFKQMNNVGKEEFQEHMRRMGRLDHPNLLPLVAYYYRKEEKLLVTDYVQNGSLAVRLHGPHDAGKAGLDWPTRLKIVKGITKGLEYLYKELPSLIAPHGHLKSSNVLLTQSNEPLLTDYSLVPVINQDLAQGLMVIYQSPEYTQEGQITKKTDVWSLGVLILEILSGRCADKGEMDLVSWVKCVEPEYWSSEVLDKEMGGTRNSEGEIVKLLRIALCCCEEDVNNRLDLIEVVEKIQEVREREHDDDFYSYASEAETHHSSATMSDEINFPFNA